MKFFSAKSLGITALLLTFGAAAHANYFEILDKQFKAAGEPVTVGNFLEYGHPKAPICVEFTKELPMNEQVVRIGLYTRSSDGPGPGLPPISVTKILLTTSEYQELSWIFDTATLELKAREIKVTQESPQKFTLLIRKGKEYIHIKRTITWTEFKTNPADPSKTIEETKTADRYGYCYPAPSSN